MSAIHLVVPAYNPGEIVIGVIERARNHADAVVIVDDGCDAENRAHLERCANLPGVSLLAHDGNRGKGCALMTGIGHCLDRMRAGDYILTMDSTPRRTLPNSEVSSPNARTCTSLWESGSTPGPCP